MLRYIIKNSINGHRFLIRTVLAIFSQLYDRNKHIKDEIRINCDYEVEIRTIESLSGNYAAGYRVDKMVLEDSYQPNRMLLKDFIMRKNSIIESDLLITQRNLIGDIFSDLQKGKRKLGISLIAHDASRVDSSYSFKGFEDAFEELNHSVCRHLRRQSSNQNPFKLDNRKK